MWRSFLAAAFAYIPARTLPKYFFDKETQSWQYETMWAATFFGLYFLATYLMRSRVKSVDKNL